MTSLEKLRLLVWELRKVDENVRIVVEFSPDQTISLIYVTCSWSHANKTAYHSKALTLEEIEDTDDAQWYGRVTLEVAKLEGAVDSLERNM